MFSNITRRVLGLGLFFAFFAMVIFSCEPAATYFSLTQEGNYDWTPGPSVDNEEYVLAYQHQGGFMLAKNSVQHGLQPLKKVIAIDQTQYTDNEGKTVPCLAFKAINYDGPWEIVTCTGQTVVAADRNLTLLPAQIIAKADSLIFVR